jgi:hypothetical protein
MLYFQPKKTAPCWSYSSSERSRNLQPAKRFFLLVSNMSHSWWTPVLYPSQHQSDMRRFNSARSGTVHGVLQIYPRNFGAMQEAASHYRWRADRVAPGRLLPRKRERERPHTVPDHSWHRQLFSAGGRGHVACRPDGEIHRACQRRLPRTHLYMFGR